jgi:hypothetical protein
MKRSLLFWIPNVLLVFVMAGSAVYYFVDTPSVIKVFGDAIAKLLGAVGILVPQVPHFLKEWSYAGYLYIMLLALQAVTVHMGFAWPMLAFVALFFLAYYGYRQRLR